MRQLLKVCEGLGKAKPVLPSLHCLLGNCKLEETADTTLLEALTGQGEALIVLGQAVSVA